MIYDAENGFYQFSEDEISTIMWALRFTKWEDRGLHVKDKTHINNIYSTFRRSVNEFAGNELSKN